MRKEEERKEVYRIGDVVRFVFKEEKEIWVVDLVTKDILSLTCYVDGRPHFLTVPRKFIIDEQL